MSPSSTGPRVVKTPRQERLLRSSLAGVASTRGELRARRPTSDACAGSNPVGVARALALGGSREDGSRPSAGISSIAPAPAVADAVLFSGLRRPSGEGRLWPGEATLLAAAVLWLLVLAYVGIGEWRRMVNDSRTDVGEIGER